MKKLSVIFGLLVGTASLHATPSGVVTLGICSGTGQGVTVTATTIDFTQPTLGGTGCTQTASDTLLNFDGGTLGSGVLGTITDLGPTAPFSQPPTTFLTFEAPYTNLIFTLTTIGPGDSDLVCENDYALTTGCSVFAGSPFVLRGSVNNTTVFLPVAGTVTDGSGVANWSGTFSTEFNLTSAQIQDIFTNPDGSPDPSGSLSAGYSSRLNVTVGEIPEPGTYAMMLSGGLLLGISALRRRKKA